MAICHRRIAPHALLFASALATPTIGYTQAAERQFDIAAQPLGNALRQFGLQSGKPVLFSEGQVRGHRVLPLKGRYPVDVALKRLMAGSGLQATSNADGVIIVNVAGPTVGALHNTAFVSQSEVGSAQAAPFEAPQQGVGAAITPPGDIVVTARRRNEASIAVPVVVTGVSQKEIERRHLTRVDELNSVIPQLQIGQGSVQGGSVVLRGIGANANTSTADQGVTFNIDGAQVARSSIRRIGQMDLEQIEVLKGPQGLFFGKNSPGGVISMRTANPGPQFEAKASALYEVVAREVQFDGFVSGPITDTLGARVAILASHMSGWQKNIFPSDLPFASPRNRLPHDREIAGRLTLAFKPSNMFDARFKLNVGRLKTAGYSETRQYIACPLGAPQIALGVNGSGETCRADNHLAYSGYGSDLASFGIPADGEPSLNQTQILSSLEMNYRPAETLTLTSLTSLYKAKIDYVDPYFNTTDPNFIIVGDYHPRIRELSQEVRLASDFAGPLNFLVGVYLQDSRFLYRLQDVAFPLNPVLFDRATLSLDGSHASVFGQVRFNPVPVIELSAGGRYSWEKKKASYTDPIGITPPADPDTTWKNFSPEFTATWRPSNKLTIFGSYKRGFLSGGYTASGAAYDQQITKGGEAGVKALLFGNRLRANVSVYKYVTTGLQITYSEGILFKIANAGKGTVKGIEADLNWQTPVEGLTLRGAIGYNNARYNIFTTNCYPGQTIAAGCNIGFANGAYSLQDLRGRPFTNAPDWSGNGGVNYERPVGSSWRLGLSADASYSSGYYTDAPLEPSSKQPGFWTLDANLRLTSDDSRWELALLGRNLTDEHPFQLSNAVPFTGGPAGTSGPTFGADRYAFINRGRQAALKVTYRFGGR